MLYAVSYIKDTVPQCILVEAQSEEDALAFFLSTRVGVHVCGIGKPNGAEKKPGIPVIHAPEDRSFFREAQMGEAVLRMKLLNIHENAVEDFENGVLNCSEFGGILYWLDEKKIKLVEEMEARTGGIVYHVIENHTEVGTMLTMLYVSKYPSEWWADRNDMMKEGYAFAYVENLDCPDFSEFGGVIIKPQFGGLARMA